MLVNRWVGEAVNVLLAFFTVYLFFLYFGIFFRRKKGRFCMLLGIIVLMAWQLDVYNIIHALSATWNICVTLGVTLIAVISIFEGKVWAQCFFSITFDAIWMLAETLIGDLLMFYGANIIEMQTLGALMSKLFLFIVIIALRKVFTNEKIRELPPGHSILIILIPIGSIYIMNAVFMLSYKMKWEQEEMYSLVSVVILLFINVLIFYIYIKLADDLWVRRINMVYEHQLDLCERHQEETELAMLQMRDVRHSMRNHLLSILAYAEKREYEQIIRFVNDIMEGGNLNTFGKANTGNIVTDSLVGYWKKTAEDKGIEFQTELDIPMEMPFRGADISLILGNLLENAVEAAEKAEGRKYIRLKLKYDKKNLLVMLENNYKGELIRRKENRLRTTKADAANHGIGLPSVKRTVEKYQGTVSIDDTMPERFIIRVVLYGASKGKVT